jgi:2-polyprenyl-3-methyl-5-hydroxy-6-metoxy-1,4-benzoquinol methylase
MQVHSPLTGSTNVVLDKEIQCTSIIKSYRGQLGIDVARYFHNLESIQIYKCLDTGFRFYHPFNIDGDSAFYEALQNLSWYYMDWKWEHEMASGLIRPAEEVLEIGCAKGSFLDRIQQKGIRCVGLELNESASDYARSRGLAVSNQSIQDHAKGHPRQYDVVCSFQVMEHVAAVGEFIQASIDALKPGGRLIVSVPNSESVIRSHAGFSTNMPPHHMGLWDMNSLISIQRVFGIELRRIELEPLQPYHVGLAVTPVLRELVERYGLLGRVLARSVGRPFISFTVSTLSKEIIGHTILVEYAKV